MRINKLEIKKLFGLFNHTIPFKIKDRITIIHGPNGVGKTTILKLLVDLFSMKMVDVGRVPFEQIEIRFDDRSKLSIIRQLKQDQSIELQFSFTRGSDTSEFLFSGTADKERSDRRFPLGLIEELISNLHQVGPREWLDTSSNEKLSLDEVFSRYGEMIPWSPRHSPIPQWLHEPLSSIPIYFIQTQRLLTTTSGVRHSGSTRNSEGQTKTTVESFAHDMSRRIQEVLRQSGVLAASLDRTFPHRLLQHNLPKTATEVKIRKKYEEQTSFRQRLMAAGLIEAEETLPLQENSLDESERKVLWHYLNDVERKLAVYDPLLKQMELFKDIINKNKFLYKNLSLDKEAGFIFTSNNGQKVPLTALSSGEQHEIVLAYELIFRAQEKSLILIDEPELSLHVTWQHKFLDDMQQISELADIDFLVATHSPSIVHRRSNLMVSLGEETFIGG